MLHSVKSATLLSDPLRRLAVSVAVSAALCTPLVMAQTEDYAEVNRLMRAGQMSEALTKADQYLAGKPRDPQMRFLKGVIQTETGKQNDAIATFSRLTEDFPELPEPYNNLAVLYAGQSQFDKARAALEMAIRTNPSYATAHENLGDVYAKLASQAYSKALQLDASNTAVAPKLSLIRNLFSADAKGVRPTTLAAATPPATPPRGQHPARHHHGGRGRARRCAGGRGARRGGSGRAGLGESLVEQEHAELPRRLRAGFHPPRVGSRARNGRPIAAPASCRATASAWT